MFEDTMDDETVKSNSTDDLFFAVKQESAADRVINSIKEALISNRLLPGDRLPSEIDLSKKLALSRGSVREALKILSALGIIEVKRGEGTYIAKSDPKVILDPLLFRLILSRAHKKELVELRELMEFAIVKLIISNAKHGDFVKIRKTIDEMEDRIKLGKDNFPEDLAQSDLAFHRALGEATKNRLVEKIYDFVMDFFAPSITLTHKKQEKGLMALSLHKNIYKALEKRDYKEALKAVEESIVAWKQLSMPIDIQ
jgi:GntR family transcriptional repressor for pyruvate dehydrogenase complex